jgi:hypothetical protein
MLKTHRVIPKVPVLILAGAVYRFLVNVLMEDCLEKNGRPAI